MYKLHMLRPCVTINVTFYKKPLNNSTYNYSVSICPLSSKRDKNTLHLQYNSSFTQTIVHCAIERIVYG